MPKNFQYGETVITLGTCASENIELIRQSDPSWWWLQLDQVPSGHIIIKTDKITPAAIDFAAHICLNAVGSKKQAACFFQKNNEQYFNIITTRISNLLLDTPDLELGEVDFKSTSKTKLMKLKLRHNS